MIAERLSTALALMLIVGCSRAHDTDARGDSAFAALQQRGETAMGVNQYKSQHVFEPLTDGGRIVLQRKEPDSAGEATIRAHMRGISGGAEVLISSRNQEAVSAIHDFLAFQRMDHRAGSH